MVNTAHMSNQRALEEFASHFDPPLKVTATAKIGGVPVAHGFMCAFHDAEHDVGITAVCYGKGILKAWLEAGGIRSDAGDVGNLMGYVFAQLSGNMPEADEPQQGEQWPPTAGQAAQPIPNLNPALGGREMITPQPGGPASEDLRKQFEAMPDPGAAADRAAVAAAASAGLTPAEALASLAERSPNPEFVDILGLPANERVELARHFPELRFAVGTDGHRRRVSPTGETVLDPTAGFATADQLNHVRRLRDTPLGRPAQRFVQRAGPPTPRNVPPFQALAACPHTYGDGSSAFRKNSIGDQSTCQMCGTQSEKAPAPEPDADAHYAATLSDADRDSFNRARKARAQALIDERMSAEKAAAEKAAGV